MSAGYALAMRRAKHLYFGRKAMVIIETVKSILQQSDALPKGQD